LSSMSTGRTKGSVSALPAKPCGSHCTILPDGCAGPICSSASCTLRRRPRGSSRIDQLVWCLVIIR
jgi:hypothetical protein